MRTNISARCPESGRRAGILLSCAFLALAAGCRSGPEPGRIPSDEELIESAAGAPGKGDAGGGRIWIRVQSYFTDDADLSAAGVRWEPAAGGAGAQGLRVGFFPAESDVAAAVSKTRRRGGNYQTQAVTVASGGHALFDVTEVLPGAVTLSGVPEAPGPLNASALMLEVQAVREGGGAVRLKWVPIVRTYDRAARILRLETAFAPALVRGGEAVVLAGTPDAVPQTLGTVFFRGRGDPPARRVIVATVRFVQ